VNTNREFDLLLFNVKNQQQSKADKSGEIVPAPIQKQNKTHKTLA